MSNQLNNQCDFRILVIDDNSSIQDDFRKILTKVQSDSELDKLSLNLFSIKQPENNLALPHFEITTASQGQEGVALIKKSLEEKKPFSLAFVDIRMPPGWDGIETIKYIWELDQDIQIVICTAYSDYSWEETVEHLGKKDNLLILKKPFDHIAVRQLACALTTKWQLFRETKQYTSMLEKEVENTTETLEQTLGKLKFQATHDALTRLPNRLMLLENIRNIIKKSDESHTIFALIFLDLDRFKLVNDSLGHAVGDDLLKLTSDRLHNILRKDDILARLGGDEFVIVLADINNEEAVINKARTILKVFQEPFHIANRKVNVTSSMGISFYPKDGTSIDILMRNADSAMYHAKELGSNNFQFYEKEMNAHTLEKLEQEVQLREAIVNQEFFLVYQPQFDFLEDKIVAVEALLRWNHPTRGVLTPIDFLPLVEETGLIVPIGEWVLRTACLQNVAWQKQGYSPIRVTVNVTTQQFKQQNLVNLIKNVLEETGLESKYLELELTENVIISSTEIMDTITKLKKLGIFIAIDDFGTGYSSLGYLKKIPLDRLKIDSSFIEEIHNKGDDNVIIRAVIALAKSLNLEVLAEGVENKNQLDFLKEYKCGEIQGYFFSKPLTVDELTTFFKDPSQKKLVTNS